MMTNALNNFVQGGQVRHPDDCLSASCADIIMISIEVVSFEF